MPASYTCFANNTVVAVAYDFNGVIRQIFPAVNGQFATFTSRQAWMKTLPKCTIEQEGVSTVPFDDLVCDDYEEDPDFVPAKDYTPDN